MVQRLNDFRVPVGSCVRLTFGRNVRKDGMEDVDEDHVAPTTETEASPSHAGSPSATSGTFNDIDEDDYFASPAPNADKSRKSEVKADVDLRSENEELKAALAQSRKELASERALVEKMKVDIVALSGACKLLKKEEMRLKIQVQQLMKSGNSTVSESQMVESMQSMLDVAERLHSGAVISVNIFYYTFAILSYFITID